MNDGLINEMRRIRALGTADHIDRLARDAEMALTALSDALESAGQREATSEVRVMARRVANMAGWFRQLGWVR